MSATTIRIPKFLITLLIKIIVIIGGALQLCCLAICCCCKRNRTPNPAAQVMVHYDSQGEVHFLNTNIDTSNNIDHNYDINNRQEMKDPLLTCQEMSDPMSQEMRDPYPMC